MKILIYADPHFCSSSSIIRGKGANGFSERINNLMQSFEFVNKTAVDYNCERIICLGDLFDKPDLSAEEIIAISKCNLGHHEFIIGNHDALSNDLLFNAVNMFKDSKIYREPTMEHIGKSQFVFLPYVTESSRKPLAEVLKEIGVDTNGNVIIFSHNDISGVQYGGFLSKVGYSIQEILDNSDLFINGHIHNGSWVSDGRILNVGSLTGLNFSNDATNWKNCVVVLDTDTFEMQFIENPYSFMFYKLELIGLGESKTVETLKSFLNSLNKDRKNIISIKVDSSCLQAVNSIFEGVDYIYYKRVVVNYGDQQVLVEEKTQEPTISMTTNYFEKFKQFIAEKFTEDNLNYKLMVEEIDRIEGGA